MRSRSLVRYAAFQALSINWFALVVQHHERAGRLSISVSPYIQLCDAPIGLEHAGGGPAQHHFGGQYAASMTLEEYRTLLEKL